jgi:hypothetical protein
MQLEISQVSNNNGHLLLKWFARINCFWIMQQKLHAAKYFLPLLEI